MKIKICGVRTVDDLLACGLSVENITNITNIANSKNLTADYVGLMYYSASKRFVNIEKVKSLLAFSSINKPQFVLVAVNPTREELAELFAENIINQNVKIIQFHGQETGMFCEEVTKKYNLQYWKALPFDNWSESQQNQLIQEYPNAEYFLIDSPKKQVNSTTFGGTGHQFDWYSEKTVNTLKQIASHKKILIAGGINPDNIQKAVKHFSQIHKNIIGFDLSSGVESYLNLININDNNGNNGNTEDFFKDSEKIRFILANC